MNTHEDSPKWFRDVYIEDKFDIQGLLDLGFFVLGDKNDFRYIESLTDYDRIERRIVKFFHLDSIYDWDTLNDPKPEKLPVLDPGEWLGSENKLPIQRN